MRLVNQLKLKHLEKKKSRLYKKIHRVNLKIANVKLSFDSFAYADTDSYKQILNAYYGKEVTKDEMHKRT